MSNTIPTGMEGLNWQQAQAAADRLHHRKNPPIQPMINGEPLTFPPYEYRPFPAAIYGPWTDETRRVALRQIAGRSGLNLNIQTERDACEEQLPAYDSRLVHDEAERAAWLARGWAEAPGLVTAAQEAIYERISREAAERAYSDRRLSAAAQAEFHAADVANGDDHLVDLPAPKKRGRTKKQTTPHEG